MSKKDPFAVALGRRGGKKRAKQMTKQERSEAARRAVEARWAKAKKKANGLPPVVGENKGER